MQLLLFDNGKEKNHKVACYEVEDKVEMNPAPNTLVGQQVETEITVQ